MSLDDEICRMLDERGVKYEIVDAEYKTTYMLDWCEHCGDFRTEIEVIGSCVSVTKRYLDPEDAVSIALGPEMARARIRQGMARNHG